MLPCKISQTKWNADKRMKKKSSSKYSIHQRQPYWAVISRVVSDDGECPSSLPVDLELSMSGSISLHLWVCHVTCKAVKYFCTYIIFMRYTILPCNRISGPILALKNITLSPPNSTDFFLFYTFGNTSHRYAVRQNKLNFIIEEHSSYLIFMSNIFGSNLENIDLL